MAAAAGTAVLRSVATKMGMTVSPRAPSLHHPLLLGPRGRRLGPTSSFRHSFSSSSSPPNGSTTPQTNNKDLTQNKNVSGKLDSAKAAYVPMAPKVAYFLLFGTLAFLHCWVKPGLDELNDEIYALRGERLILIKAVEECQRTHIKAKDVLANSSQAQSNLEQSKESGGQEAS